MNKGWKFIIFVGLLVLLAVYYLPGEETTPEGFSCDWEERFDPYDVIRTNHALCRMNCRQINENDFQDTYLFGEVNCKKSGWKDGQLRYALEKKDADGERIRIIIGDNGDEHVLITAIRLDKEFDCHCN